MNSMQTSVPIQNQPQRFLCLRKSVDPTNDGSPFRIIYQISVLDKMPPAGQQGNIQVMARSIPFFDRLRPLDSAGPELGRAEIHILRNHQTKGIEETRYNRYSLQEQKQAASFIKPFFKEMIWKDLESMGITDVWGKPVGET